MTTMYGIPNCDTVKKAKTWLINNEITFDFHDYKKSGVDIEILKFAIERFGLDLVVNKRGTTYRKLDDSVKAQLNTDAAINVLVENPSMIKRPLLVQQDKAVIGFKTDEYEEFFNNA